MRKAPAPACEQETRRVASRRGTVAPVFAASNRSQASLASSHAEVLMTAESLRCVPLELEELGRVIACYRKLSRVIAVIASYRGDNSVIAGPRTLRNRGAGPSSRRRNAKTQALTQACRSQSSASSSSRHFSSHCLCSSVSSSKPGSKMSSSSRVARTTESVGVCRAARSRAHPPSGRQGEVSGGLSNLSQIIANYRTLSQLSRVIAAR